MKLILSSKSFSKTLQLRLCWLLFIYFALGFSFAFSQTVSTQNQERKKIIRRSSSQLVAMIGSWKETSILLKSDGNKYKINTLNTVARLGVFQYLLGRRLWLHYGVIAGHSENDSDSSDFIYFQRSVLLTGIEASLGTPLFLSPGVEIGATMGGIFRTIKHSLPSSDYKFSTGSKFIPLFSLELLWRLSHSFSWRQSVGTQGTANDTLWSAGFSYDW